MNQIRIWLLAAATSFMLTACGGGDDTPVAPVAPLPVVTASIDKIDCPYVGDDLIIGEVNHNVLCMTGTSDGVARLKGLDIALEGTTNFRLASNLTLQYLVDGKWLDASPITSFNSSGKLSLKSDVVLEKGKIIVMRIIADTTLDPNIGGFDIYPKLKFNISAPIVERDPSVYSGVTLKVPNLSTVPLQLRNPEPLSVSVQYLASDFIPSASGILLAQVRVTNPERIDVDIRALWQQLQLRNDQGGYYSQWVSSCFRNMQVTYPQMIAELGTPAIPPSVLEQQVYQSTYFPVAVTIPAGKSVLVAVNVDTLGCYAPFYGASLDASMQFLVSYKGMLRTRESAWAPLGFMNIPQFPWFGGKG